MTQDSLHRSTTTERDAAPVPHRRRRRGPRRHPRAWLAILALVATTAACAGAAPPPARRILTLTMHPDQNARIGGLLTRALARALPDTDIEIREELRQLDMMVGLQDAAADIAFAYADTAYLAHVGEFNGRRFDRLRAIATLNMSPVYVLVRGDSDIDDLDDLQGRRVNMGQPGTRTALTVGTVLNTFGDRVRKSYEPFLRSLAKLEGGELDVIFAVGGYDPIQGLTDSIASGRIRLLSLSKATSNRLRRDHPFVHPIAIPSGLYREDVVLTVGIERLLLCREGLDKEVVYQVTRAFFEALPELSTSDRQLRDMNVEAAPATAVPLHEGAARYYREQEQM